MADKSGYLVKEGGTFKTWRKRWMVLKNNVVYYSKQQGTGELGLIRLHGVNPDMIVNTTKKKKPNCFEIPTANRTYYLSAESEKEKESWMTAIKQSITQHSNARLTTSGSAKSIGVNDFDLMQVVGKGSFGKVIQVKKKDTGKIYAMKVLNKKNILENGELEHTRTEKNILQNLCHPFLINLAYSFQTEDKLYFIMDFINGGELFYHLQKDQKFEPNRVKFYAAEICTGLEYLHASGVIYRDLKPENILINEDGHIVLTDFGISKQGLDNESTTQTFCGTPEYLAPEVLQGKGYTKAVDWWSFGTLVFEMLTGLPPYYSQDVQQMYYKILNSKLEFTDDMDEDTRSLLSGLMERDPSKRLADPTAIKAHPYFKGMDWDALLRKEVPPPYIPPVKGKTDTSMVDTMFTSERVTLSEGSDANDAKISTDNQKKFEGFTFVPESNMKK